MLSKLMRNKFSRFYNQYFKEHILFIVGLLLLIITGVITSNIGPYMYGRMVDFITQSNLAELKTYIVMYFVVTLISIILGIIEGYIGQMFSYKITTNVKKNLFNKIIRMRFKKLDKYSTGELISRLESDAGAIVDYYINVATSIAMIIFNLIVSFYFVFSISSGLSFIAIFFIPASITITLAFRKKFRKLSEQQKKYSDKYYGFINETFSNIKGMRSYQLEDNFAEKFKGFIAENRSILKKSIYLGNSMSIINNLVSLTFMLIIIYASAVLIMEGKLSIGSMVAFNTYIDKLFNAVSRILNLNISAQNISVSLDRIETLQNEPDESILYCKNGITEDVSINKIDLQGVSFQYDKHYVLKNISLMCKKPGVYSIVGKNGCGKSTLAKLLMNFYDADDGNIFLNNVDISEISMKKIRENITYIQKEVFIVNDTLINNLKFANQNASETDIERACIKSGLSEVIDQLPQKHSTRLGENGSMLSSGQKQKLNIARALLRHTPILLLDEVTSDLDGKAEKDIVKIIHELANQTIVLFISHKITSIEKSDMILVMDNGTIVNAGTHTELMKKSELYQELFKYEDSQSERA